MKFLLFSVFLAFTVYASGKDVPVDRARTVATRFLLINQPGRLKSGPSFRLELVEMPSGSPGMTALKSAPSGQPVYIFNINAQDGFILVSGDDGAVPVLGYALSGTFDPVRIPSNFKKWFEGYKEQIRYIRAHPGEVTREVETLWEELSSGISSLPKVQAGQVGPLLTSQWNQSPYYNALCPLDNEEGERTVTGCAATAMAQIMNYWEYPVRGSGFHSYQHDTYGNLSANFGSTTYDWSSMPDNLTGPNLAVATLMYHCGVSIDMDYGTASNGGSGAYLVSLRSPVENCVEYALKTYFGYKQSLHGIVRQNYTTSTWIAALKTELDAGKPVAYAGSGSEGGHAFVCDGYDSNNYFHFNWGWSGYYDGFFSLDALDPEGTGIGGGSGGYNSNQQALIGIEPPDNTVNYDLTLYASLTISENPVRYTRAFDLKTDVANFGKTTFSGDMAIAMFDENYRFVEFGGLMEGLSLGSNMHFSEGLTFSNPGSVTLLPGNYHAITFFRPTGGDWTAAGDGSFTNNLPFKIYYTSDIELYDDFVISTGDAITSGQPFTVTADILNNGTQVFNGDFEVALYDIEGNYAAPIETVSGADLQPGYYYDDMAFHSEGLTVTPGTYLLALSHKPAGGEWILSGSSNHANPVKIIVKAAPVGADKYENNDTGEKAYAFNLAFTGNSASATTDGSTIHLGTDVDFYRISLPGGYNYEVTARVHDSYNSGNGQTYTDDVLWTWDTGNGWSEAYDDIMEGTIHVGNGGQIRFGVAPFYEGQTGTYLLDIRVTRTVANTLDPLHDNGTKVYPNPATDRLTIEGDGMIRSVEITDMQGRTVLEREAGKAAITIDISGLEAGVYFVHVIRENQVIVKKILKP